MSGRPNYNDHSSHSNLVRGWRAKQARNSFDEDVMKWATGTPCRMKSPHDGYTVSVSFSRYTEHPEFVRVHSTNWRAEHEPRGVYHAKDAEAFYTRLKAAGFVQEENK